MNAFTVILIVAVLFLCFSVERIDASKASRRRRRRERRRVAYIKSCNEKQPLHTEAILASETLDIFSRDFVCSDNLQEIHQQTCPVLNEQLHPKIALKDWELVDRFKKYYMEIIYTPANFPNTYRPDATIGELDVVAVKKYYFNNCIVPNASGIGILYILLGFSFIVMVISSCAKK
jgi:hypothetical protein